MSWFKRAARNALLTLGILASLGAVSGCSFAPVYGDASVAEQVVALNYAKPLNRLEQIVYQDLALRLGAEAGPDAPLVTILVDTNRRSLTRSKTVNPTPSTEVTAIGTVTVTRGAEVVTTFVRKATATYTQNLQVLSNKAAETDGEERAAEALAESIRLALIAMLAVR